MQSDPKLRILSDRELVDLLVDAHACGDVPEVRKVMWELRSRGYGTL